jgi:protein-disulfide isomerase
LDKLPKTAAAAPQRPKIDYDKVYNLPLGTSTIKGNKNASITVVEFSDFQCPYCARLQPTLRDVLKAYPNDVKLVYKDFPLSFHKQAKNAAKAARAAGEQGKYWEMHDLIFENFAKVNEVMFKDFATKLNLDMTKFLADFSGTKYDSLIQQDINLGRQAGVTGTPSLFMNGKRMQRRSLDDFKQQVDAYLKKK